MAPLVESFPVSALPLRAQITMQDRRRKGFNGDLKACELFEMMQYKCEVQEPGVKDSLVRCWEVQRLFRKCQDRNGTFTVETTDWEGMGKKSA